MRQILRCAFSCFATIACFIVATKSLNAASGSDCYACIRLEQVSGLRGKDTLNAGDTIQLYLKYVNRTECSFALSNAFRVYSRESLTSGAIGSGTAVWSTTPPVNRPFGVALTLPSQSYGIQVDTTGFMKKKNFGGLYRFGCFSCDGQGADTIVFSAAANDLSQTAFAAGDSGVPFVIWLVTRAEDTGKVICLDSSTNYRPSGSWKWPGFGRYPCTEGTYPDWSGSRCFTLAPYKCCVGATGNVDCDAGDHVDISDISCLIDHLYLTNRPLCCPEQADCDGLGGVDVADLSALISHLYISFMPLAACP